MVIKVTKNASISSVHIGSIKNPLMLFNLLTTMLGDDAKIFTKPNIKNSKRETNQIEWSIEEDREYISYTDADDATKESIKALLKRSVDNILRDKEPEQVELLRKSLEIPDESDIFLVGDEVVLTNWGHIQNSYNARRGIVFNLIGDIKSSLTVEVVQDNKPVPNCRVILSWDGGELEATTNESGVVKEIVPVDTDIEIEVECEGQSVKESKSIRGVNEYIKIILPTKETPPPPAKRNWWWLLLLLLGLALLGLGFYLWKSQETPISIEPPTPPKPKVEVVKRDIKISISWQSEEGDFDLHLIDSCGDLVDNFHKSSNCKSKRIEFIKQSQGFDCSGGVCSETILAPDGLEGGVKIVINQYSSKKSPAKVKLTIKKGDEVKVEREFTISSPHPMLKKVEPNTSDIIFEWSDDS